MEAQYEDLYREDKMKQGRVKGPRRRSTKDKCNVETTMDKEPCATTMGTFTVEIGTRAGDMALAHL